MKKTVIKFSAIWCGPCRVYAPVFEKVKQTLQSDQIEFVSIDVESDTEGLSKQYDVKGIPTTVVISDGESKQQSGRMSEQELTNFITGE